MTIRQAFVETDWPQLHEAAKDFLSRMDYVDYVPEDPVEFEAAVAGVLSAPSIDIFVYEVDERIVAAIGMHYGTFVWNPKLLSMEEVFWWSAPDAPATAAMRLLRRVVRQAQQAPDRVVVAFRSLTSSPEGVDRIYSKLGLREIERGYLGIF
jgi:hypothetical protein